MPTIREQVRIEGFAIVPELLSTEEAGVLLDAITSQTDKTVRRGGIRNLLNRCPEVDEFARSPAIRDLVDSVLDAQSFPVRAILFDKTPQANWKVPWHQDLTIAVQDRIDLAGFGPWSIKDGVTHVQPPTEILESMLAVRIHLDKCGEENGPVRVIPRTHSRGRLTAEEILSIEKSSAEATCTVDEGGVLLMRPLLLHASSAATSPEHRRVIHLEYASCQLPGGLRWYAEP